LKSHPDITAGCGRFFLCLTMFACGSGVSAQDIIVSNLPPPAATQIVFSRDIRPIFDDNCLRCHGPEKPRSHFRLDNRAGALAGGDNNTNDIVPGQSTNSLLIAYIAWQVEDMEMPPPNRGKQLTPGQISLLRAWIDQGAAWDTNEVDNDVHGYFSSILGGTTVSGDKNKYQELYWQKAGVMGGEEFQLSQQTSPDTRWLLNGHLLVPNDYEINLNVDRNDFGFIHSGWQQYRKYYDDTGGYEPSLVPTAPTLGEDLYLDIGKAWIDLGLTLPRWPQMVLGYEYDYRRGNEATTDWGTVGSGIFTARNIAPASEGINEGVNVIKFSLQDDLAGASVADNFRGEFYHLSTSLTNTIFPLTPQNLNNRTSYFEGANTLRIGKKFNDWFFGSAGYLFSKLNSDASFSMNEPSVLEVAAIPQITLQRESNVGNLNGLLGPFDGLTISSGIQAEWDRQSGVGAGTVDQDLPPPLLITPFTVSSSYDDASLQENLSLRYAKIRYTGLYAEAHTEQEDMDQHDQFATSGNILNTSAFYQHTAFTSQQYDARGGFDTSPWRTVSFGADYRFYESDSHYTSDPLIPPILAAYPTFILSRNIITHEAEARLVLQPVTCFKTTLTYQYQTTDYGLDTRPFTEFGEEVTAGSELTAAREFSHIVSLNASLTPVSRLYLSTLFSWQLSSLTTQAQGSPEVAPYRGDTYTVMADATYVLSQATDLFAGYFFSEANYGQNNFAAGLPLGIAYRQNSVQVTLTHRFSENLSVKALYRFACYDEPSDGGATNFRANSIFGTITWRF
jgi:Planctomycete cytochrome C